ncbi:MAG TPA: glycosyltransferase 87 family protein [Solirubrobacteraceae bacterium]|nr:glycosyltransferase 87 family protein [Solirubrobacteraceae bacterium]
MARERREGAPSRGLRLAGWLGVGGVLAGVALVCGAGASGPTTYVPGRSGGWAGWVAGPLEGLLPALTPGSFEAYTLLMCVGYGLVLAGARALPARGLAWAIVAANLILLVGPPLISQDVFGYLSFARMGVLHGLDPYTHVAAEMPTDPIVPFIGWPEQHSPYGPLFTLASYATAPLGLAGGLWTLKAAAVAGSLAATGLTARAAALAGGSARWAGAFVGLNPVMLELAVGGAHNDTLVLAFLAGALALTAGSSARFRAGALALAAGVGIKLSAGIALPFLVLGAGDGRARVRTGLAALAGLAGVAALGLVGFGSHALGFLGAVGEQQQLVASHSIPAETARWLGLSGTPSWWRHVYVGAFLGVVLYALWRTARGADWRAAAGWSTLALLVSTAWLLPWYAIWPLPLAAVCRDRRLRAATLLLCAYAVLIHLALADPLLKPPKLPGLPRHGHVGALGR